MLQVELFSFTDIVDGVTSASCRLDFWDVAAETALTAKEPIERE